MSSRRDRKERARAERLEAERQAQRAERRRRITRLGIVAGLAVALVVGVVAISQSGSGSGADLEADAAEVEALFAGIPQSGSLLGAPAPLTLREFADPQCPFCADYADQVLPVIVERYVEPGDLRLDLDLLTFLGPESETAARVAIAAGEQGRMWEFVHLLFRDAGGGATVNVTEELIREVAEATPGLDAERALREAEVEAVSARLAEADQRADELGVDSTPSFFVSRGDEQPKALEVAALDPAAFTEELDALLAGAPGG
jgi:protein-disulfide isomerase